MQLLEEDFDKIINLEKNPDICKFANQINAWSKYGFRFDKRTQKAEAYDRAFEVLTVSSNIDIKRQNGRTFQDLLFNMVGAKWDGEELVLGYKPTKDVEYDIGFNMKVGKKWPIKAWPETHWDQLEEILKKDGLMITRQDSIYEEVKNDINKYIDWLNSCKMIVSNDSLGLHLGIALKKKVIGLFGPTPSAEIYFYGQGKAILAEPIKKCVPCFKNECEYDLSCMKDISVNKVYREIKSYLKK
jgi:heptosyltransferase-2